VLFASGLVALILAAVVQRPMLSTYGLAIWLLLGIGLSWGNRQRIFTVMEMGSAISTGVRNIPKWNAALERRLEDLKKGQAKFLDGLSENRRLILDLHSQLGRMSRDMNAALSSLNEVLAAEGRHREAMARQVSVLVDKLPERGAGDSDEMAAAVEAGLTRLDERLVESISASRRELVNRLESVKTEFERSSSALAVQLGDRIESGLSDSISRIRELTESVVVATPADGGGLQEATRDLRDQLADLGAVLEAMASEQRAFFEKERGEALRGREAAKIAAAEFERIRRQVEHVASRVKPELGPGRTGGS